MATDTLAQERLSAAFKRWDQNRTLLHHKRRQLAGAADAFRHGKAPDPILLAIEVKCIDELCDQLFARLMDVANEIEGARNPWAVVAACGESR